MVRPPHLKSSPPTPSPESSPRGRGESGRDGSWGRGESLAHYLPFLVDSTLCSDPHERGRIPSPSRGEGEDEGDSSSRNCASLCPTPSMLENTSLFQNLMTRYPSLSSHAV